MQSVFNNMAVTPTTVTMTANSGGTFWGGSGARYVFPPFSISDDSVPVNGNVTIQVSEFLKKSDMIFSSVLPFSNGYPLLPGGAYYINITQNGLPLSIAPGSQYQVFLPLAAAPPSNLQFFLGRPDDTSAYNQVNWQPADTSLGMVQAVGDTLMISSDSTHFNGAFAYLDSPAYQTFTVTVTSPINTFSDSIAAYAVMDGTGGIVAMTQVSNHVVSVSNVPNVPVHFVVFTVIDGNFYADILAATPVAGHNYTVYLTKSSPAQLRIKVDAL
jgi:hypothetical protein